MSDSSLSLTAVPVWAGPAEPGDSGAELLSSLAPLLARWLPHQRWFAGKGRPISGFGLVAATELLPCAAGGTAPGLLHLLVRTRQPAHPLRSPDSAGGPEAIREQETARESETGAAGRASAPGTPEAGTSRAGTSAVGTSAAGEPAAGTPATGEPVSGTPVSVEPVSGAPGEAAAPTMPGEGRERAGGGVRGEIAERGGESAADCYQLLLGVRALLPPDLETALVGHPSTGPLRGRAVYEALHDRRLAEVLLERLRAPGSLGPLRFVREPDAAIPSGLRPRRLTAEQSNSSVVYGDAYILKVFRRVERGINPDLELPLALSRGGSDRVPAPTAWFEAAVPASAGGEGGSGAARGERRPVGRGEGRADGRGEGPADGRGEWADEGGEAVAGEPGPGSPGSGTEVLEGGEAVARSEAARRTDAAANGGKPAAPLTLGVLQPFLPGCRDGWQLALEALEERSDFTHAAFALGRATAEVHTGLAAALPVTVLDRHALEYTAAIMAERLETAAATVPELRAYRDELREAFLALADLGRRGHTFHAQRVHGDLHLGQVLREESGHWSLIDFEGEPARPLAQRRVPQPVVRDIAGMLRSFDYAAHQGTAQAPDAWTREWAEANRAAFCAGYSEVSGSDPRDEESLLRAYETDKAVYEVVYEARHRPSWLGIPMSAIRRLAAPPTR